MATETLPQGPKAFAGWDSSMFLAWIRAMSDMPPADGESDASTRRGSWPCRRTCPILKAV